VKVRALNAERGREPVQGQGLDAERGREPVQGQGLDAERGWDWVLARGLELEPELELGSELVWGLESEQVCPEYSLPLGRVSAGLLG
jgi:hypothetical protein